MSLHVSQRRHLTQQKDCAGACQVALSLANLAALMQAQGKYAQAEEHLRRALSIREDAFGPDHPWVRLRFEAWQKWPVLVVSLSQLRQAAQ